MLCFSRAAPSDGKSHAGAANSLANERIMYSGITSKLCLIGYSEVVFRYGDRGTEHAVGLGRR